jgi:hypothetical protein
VIAGRRTFELAGRWQGDHHHGVPIFVLIHNVPVDSLPGSAAQARAAAGDGDGMVHGAGAAQALLRASQLDELELHVVPVPAWAGTTAVRQTGGAHRARSGPQTLGPRRDASALPRDQVVERSGLGDLDRPVSGTRSVRLVP